MVVKLRAALRRSDVFTVVYLLGRRRRRRCIGVRGRGGGGVEEVVGVFFVLGEEGGAVGVAEEGVGGGLALAAVGLFCQGCDAFEP